MNGLKDCAEVAPWKTVFGIGEYTLESLQRAATDVDFAVIIWGRDDFAKLGKGKKPVPRDNVVYEAGLFAGHLGPHRTFIVHAKDTKIPTDYLGVTTERFDADNPRLQKACSTICKQIEKLGRKPILRIAGHWWQLVPVETQADASVVSFVQVTPQYDSRSVPLLGKAWTSHGKKRSWRSLATALDEEKMILQYSWEGEAPNERGVPQFFGVGEINFGDKPVSGSYSSTARSPDGLDQSTRLSSAWYFRASPEEVDVMRTSEFDQEARRRLIEEQLKRRLTLGEF